MTLTRRLARGRIYYGWYIVAIAFISQALSYGMQTYTYGLFFKPMNDELGWNRGELSGVQSFSSILNAFLYPLFGPLVDKRGGRELMIIGAILTGAGIAATGLVQELWQFYFVRGVVVTMGTLFLGNLVVTVAISNWFVKQRGRAMGIGATGMSLAAILLTPFIQGMISAQGWRMTWAALGLLVVLFVTPPAVLLMSRRPEDVGLLPDGEKALVSAPTTDGDEPAHQVDPIEPRWERRQAMRTSALWLIISAFAVSGLGLSAVLLHLYPFLTDKGLSPEVGAMGVSILGVAGLISKPLWGLAIEKVTAKYCAVADFVFCGAGITFILLADSVTAVYAAIFFFGIGVGGVLVTQEVVWADYYGRLTLGAIRSIGLPITTIASAAGPIFAGMAYDIYDSYVFAFIVFIVSYAVAAFLLLLSRRPQLSTARHIV